MSIKQAIKKVAEKENLSVTEARSAAEDIMSGRASNAEIAGLLIGLKLKGETAEELEGFARVMREKATKVMCKKNTLVDTCGTGGDGSNTFNVSTVAGIVAAGAGCRVAKHGNRSVSSNCGSADILQFLGVNTDIGPEIMAKSIEQANFGFLFAPKLHSAMKYAMTARKALGVRTIFNMLGPITNPAGVKRQLIGVYADDIASIIAETLKKLGSEHVMIVHSRDGLDEISVSSPTNVVELKRGDIMKREIYPSDFGLAPASLNKLKGKGPRENADIALSILNGEKGARRDFVLINAGAVIYVSGYAESIRDGIIMAEESIDSGRAMEVLNNLVEITNRN